MKSSEKIGFMHARFGTAEGICKHCSNFQRWLGNKLVRKCRIYGVSHSEATDWNATFNACGMYNKDPGGIGNLYKERARNKIENRRNEKSLQQLPGQIAMELEEET